MELANGTAVHEFILLSFGVGEDKCFLLLIFFTALYVLTLAENFIIISLVVLDTQLAHLPMYILLSNFSWLEVCYTTATIPRMLSDLAFPPGIISFQACFLQFYIFFSLGMTESFFLSAMALDRYLAICHPLRYPQIMTPQTSSNLVAICWLLGFLWYPIPVILVSTLSFCGPNIIDHFMCDLGPIIALACPPLGYIPIVCQVFMTVGIIGNFFFVLFSYAIVIFTLMKNSSHGNRMKAFSTISSHLGVVIFFYGAVVATYVTPGGESHADVTKAITLFFTAITPLLNPLIYCLRNDQVKQAMGRLLKRNRTMWGKREEDKVMFN